jgi:hypothetical protein
MNHCLSLEDKGSISGWCTPIFPDWLWVRSIPFIEATAGTHNTKVGTCCWPVHAYWMLFHWQ